MLINQKVTTAIKAKITIPIIIKPSMNKPNQNQKIMQIVDVILIKIKCAELLPFRLPS